METLDADDWQAARNGTGEALGRVFDRHKDRIRRHSLRLVPTATDADDVVAVTFLEAWRNRDRVRFTDGSMLPWLLVIATNSTHNLSRSSRRYRALLARLPVDPPVPDHADAYEGDAERALRDLSLADRQVIGLCVLEGLSEREAAAALGIPSGTVKSRLSRAKARLARHPALSMKEAPNDA